MTENPEETNPQPEQAKRVYGNTSFKLIYTDGTKITEIDFSSEPRQWIRGLNNLLMTLPTLQERLGVAGLGAAPLPVKTIVGNYAATTDDEVILCDCTATPITVTLPPAAYSGLLLLIVKIDSGSNAVLVQPQGADMIEASATKSLTAQWTKASLVANGAATWIDQGQSEV